MEYIESRRLKTLLFDKDITYAKLGKKIGISENNITMKINGKRRWWIDECIEITRILGYTEIEEVFPEIYSTYIKNPDKQPA